MKARFQIAECSISYAKVIGISEKAKDLLKNVVNIWIFA